MANLLYITGTDFGLGSNTGKTKAVSDLVQWEKKSFDVKINLF